ncbi:MAG: hypothetical protein KY476_09075 [Planctomycetes bacterium]|nr:hypothetical protein [Planctomycetota bacterium]
MNFRALVPLAAAFSLCSTAAWAAELHLEFVQGLRAKGYFDTAVEYLERIEAEPDVPPEVKTVIPYEKGVTLLAGSRTLSPELRAVELDKARAHFAAFSQANPEHPLSALANSEQAKILLENARIIIWKLQSPGDKGNEPAMRDEARKLIAQARDVFQKAHDRYKAEYEKFPVHIPDDQKQQLEARRQVELAYMQAQFDLAMCTYEEAQTWPGDSDDFKRILTKAAEEFEQIHTKYRSITIGLYARMWQAKCFEEQDDLRKALGIYNELLGHPGTSRTMQVLKSHVRHFWCICQNLRDEHVLVVDAADQWLKENKAYARTQTGLGIRWERVLALEEIAKRRDLQKAEKERTLRLALNEAQDISRFAGRYKDLAAFAVPRLKVALEIDPGDPRDFDTALGQARTMIDPGIGERLQALDQEQAGQKRPDEIAALEQDLQSHLRDTARILNLALEYALAERPEVAQINEARYYLAYTHYMLDRPFDAAVLGEFVGRRFPTEDSEIPQKAAYLAMAAWVKAYLQSKEPEPERSFEIGGLERVCKLITETWPESVRAQQARMQLGLIYARREQPVEAARWYSSVPEGASDYAEAQLAAGQAYWNAYLSTSAAEAEQRPPQEELTKWQSAADQHLRTGMAKVAAETAADKQPPAELITAKVTLAQILINDGKYDEAIKLLREDPHAPEKAIAVAEKQPRPRQGIQSSAFASLVYQLLLRSYVGTQNIDEALKVMDALEKSMPEDDDGSTLTALYQRLGENLKSEIERLRVAGDQERLNQVLTSFEQFLDQLQKRSDTMNYSALIWIAETFYSLAEGMGNTDPRADTYYNKAARTYEDILQRPAGFVPGGKETGVKLRLVNCKRSAGEYGDALKMVSEILVKNQRVLEGQMYAAQVLQSWGESNQADTQKYLMESITGRDIEGQKNVIWGWAGIVRKLSGRGMDQYQDERLQARLNAAEARRKYGLLQSSRPKRLAELEHAKTELEMFGRATRPETIGTEWWQKFDGLYRQVQNDMLQNGAAIAQVEPLPEPPKFQIAETETQPSDATAQTNASGEKPSNGNTSAAPVKDDEASSPLMAILAIVVAVAAAGGIVYWMIQSQKNSRRRVVYAAATAPTLPSAGAGDGRKAAAPRSRRPQPKRPQTGRTAKPATGATSAAAVSKPASTKPAAGGPSPTSGPKPSGQ